MLHYQPKLRGIEKVRETAGIYKNLDSVGLDRLQDKESANTGPTIVCKQTIWYLGVKTVDPS